MRYAIISDIHANLAAFRAVLDDIERQGGLEELWCLGDVVGYGPDPGACLELLQQYRHVCVAGNHDWAAIGEVDTSNFNNFAAEACHWTAGQLSTEDKNYLENLPLVINRGDFTLVHGSPREPIWESITSAGIARENFIYFQSRFCLAGHSHIPGVFQYEEKDSCSLIRFSTDAGIKLGEHRLIINPGGVGQPRDGDPRASYALYDSEAGLITLCRVSYEIEDTQARMVKQGLPLRLISRLNYGM